MIPPTNQFDAEYDARTLAEAKVIENDKARLTAARTAANKLAKDAMVQVETYTGLAKSTYDHPDSVKARKERGLLS